MSIKERTEGVTLEMLLDVGYEIETNPGEGRLYPINILFAKFRGKDILNLMFVGHILHMQRVIFERLQDAEN